MRTVISLTTIPSRFPEITQTLESLLAQTAQIDEIRLVVPQKYRRFPDYDGHLPDVPKGIRLVRPDEDLGPATKVLFTAQEHWGQDDLRILFCDDDRIYVPDWAASLLAEHDKRPTEVVALCGFEIAQVGLKGHAGRPTPRFARQLKALDLDYRWRRLKQQMTTGKLQTSRRQKPARRLMRRAGYADVLEGFGGVIVRPDMFDARAFDIPPVCWTVDDVWLSGWLAVQGIPIWVPHNLPEPHRSQAHDLNPLAFSVIDGTGRAEANRNAAEYFRDTFQIWNG